MKDTLLIIFVKNIILGKVKTRLAKDIGTRGAFEVYKHIVDITEKETAKVDADVHIYFSDVIIKEKWKDYPKYVQQGADLGERMKNAFQQGFEQGYQRIVLIGSDLPDITSTIVEEGLEQLTTTPVVFGLAEDGGYYLIGLTHIIYSIFDEKPWSTSNLLQVTLDELKDQKVAYQLLPVLNDIDTLEDLKTSHLYHHFESLILESQRIHRHPDV